jgi:membrane protein implicated in regulation of membrane protease activity
LRASWTLRTLTALWPGRTTRIALWTLRALRASRASRARRAGRASRARSSSSSSWTGRPGRAFRLGRRLRLLAWLLVRRLVSAGVLARPVGRLIGPGILVLAAALAVAVALTAVAFALPIALAAVVLAPIALAVAVAVRGGGDRRSPSGKGNDARGGGGDALERVAPARARGQHGSRRREIASRPGILWCRVRFWWRSLRRRDHPRWFHLLRNRQFPGSSGVMRWLRVSVRRQAVIPLFMILHGCSKVRREHAKPAQRRRSRQ